MITLLIAGSRTFTDYSIFCSKVLGILDLIKKENPSIIRDNFRIISGGANGTDTLAEKFAKMASYKFDKFSADWEKYGKNAGFVRNQIMVRETRESEKGYILCFWDGKSPGTKHTMDLSRWYKIPCYIYLYNQNYWIMPPTKAN